MTCWMGIAPPLPAGDVAQSLQPEVEAARIADAAAVARAIVDADACFRLADEQP